MCIRETRRPLGKIREGDTGGRPFSAAELQRRCGGCATSSGFRGDSELGGYYGEWIGGQIGVRSVEVRKVIDADFFG